MALDLFFPRSNRLRVDDLVERELLVARHVLCALVEEVWRSWRRGETAEAGRLLAEAAAVAGYGAAAAAGRAAGSERGKGFFVRILRSPPRQKKVDTTKNRYSTNRQKHR